jgi:hypothetical protein
VGPPDQALDEFVARRVAEEHLASADHAAGARTAEHLLAHERLLLVLDGLDELPADRHGAAIEAVDRFAAVGGPLVLTCRGDEYETAVADTGVVWSRAAVVELSPVDVRHVVAYLRHPAPARARWRPVFDHLVARPDGPLAWALSTPLMATLARARYQLPATDPAELLEARSSGAVTRLLLDGFVPTLYTDDPARRGYPADAVVRWLASLAYLLDRTASRDLWWWTLRPDLYTTRTSFARGRGAVPQQGPRAVAFRLAQPAVVAGHQGRGAVQAPPAEPRSRRGRDDRRGAARVSGVDHAAESGCWCR